MRKLFWFSDSSVQESLQESYGCCDIASYAQLLRKLVRKQPVHFSKHLKDLHWYSRVLKSEHVRFAQLQISHSSVCWDWSVDAQSGHSLLLISLRQLFLYNMELTGHWKCCSKVWRCVWPWTKSSLFPLKKQKGGQKDQDCKKETLEEQREKTFLELISKTKSTQANGLVSEKDELNKNSNFHLGLRNFVICFPDGVVIILPILWKLN